MTATLSKLTADGRVEIPEDLRRALGLKPEDRVALSLDQDSIRLRRIDPPPTSDYFWVERLEEWRPWSEVSRLAWDEHAAEVERRDPRADEDRIP